MSNPWADIYDDLRSPYLQEKKAKKDYDGDGKVESGKDEYFGSKDKAIKAAIAAKKGGVKKEGYMSKDKEDHDTGGFRISNKEAKAAKERLKKKMKKEDTEVDECWKTHKKVGTKMKGGKVVNNCVPKNEDVSINNVDGTTTEIVDVIKAPKMVAAPKFSSWREDFVWDEPVDEALKTPKLDIKEKGVKNKIDVNPTVETEEAKYDNTKSPDYEKKKKALAKKHGGAKNIKGHPQYEHHQKDENGNEIPHQLDEIDNMGGKVAAGLATGAVMGGLKLMGAAKNAAERIRKRKTDAMKQYEEVEKKNFDEAQVKYYSGQDRNPNTGLPKGLKPPVRTEKEVNKKLDRTTLAQSYEPEGEVVSDGYQRNPERDTRSARQRRMDSPDRGINSQAFRDFMAAQQKPSKPKKKKDVKEDIVDESVYDTVKKVLDTGSNFVKKNPIGKALGNVVKPFKSTDGGSNRTSATAASQKAKGLRVSEGIVTELNRYEKETGKSSGSMNMPKGKPTSKGGTSSPVMRAVRTKIRKETGKPTGQTSKKKGEKGNRQPGDRKTTPADSIAKRRESRADAEKLMRDTRGT